MSSFFAIAEKQFIRVWLPPLTLINRAGTKKAGLTVRPFAVNHCLPPSFRQSSQASCASFRFPAASTAATTMVEPFFISVSKTKGLLFKTWG